MQKQHCIKFFTGRNSSYLAKEIVRHYGTTLGKSSVTEFSDGEFQPSFDESVR
ncbi:MAG TPA: ribose-phosphate pyrophosphokinase-like domain-containing protein, partial [Tenuifilaceae bacterium]|nr:ribose-phosphate pyrophosphokinase-like domain-containing protein [Tenuifilaceae bacterium]